MLYEYKFLISLVFTIVIESAALFILIRLLFKKDNKRITNIQLLFAGFLCSFATLPYLWFILPILIKTRVPYIIFGEIFVILIESLILFFTLRLDYKKSVTLSMMINLISFILGWILLEL
jgi:hypothetical protein